MAINTARLPIPLLVPAASHRARTSPYVVNYNPNGDGSVTKIDVSGDSVSFVQALGVGSVYEALPPSSTALFVANSGETR